MRAARAATQAAREQLQPYPGDLLSEPEPSSEKLQRAQFCPGPDQPGAPGRLVALALRAGRAPHQPERQLASGRRGGGLPWRLPDRGPVRAAEPQVPDAAGGTGGDLRDAGDGGALDGARHLVPLHRAGLYHTSGHEPGPAVPPLLRQAVAARTATEPEQGTSRTASRATCWPSPRPRTRRASRRPCPRRRNGSSSRNSRATSRGSNAASRCTPTTSRCSSSRCASPPSATAESNWCRARTTWSPTWPTSSAPRATLRSPATCSPKPATSSPSTA